jgi:hypothetical protein
MQTLVRILQTLQSFNTDDLAANQRGVLSHRQRRLYALGRLFEHVIGAMVATYLFYVVTRILGQPLDSDSLRTAFGLITILALILFAIHIRPAFETRVKTIQGRLAKRVIISDWPIFVITVGKVLFYIPYIMYEALEDDALYNAYYLERSQRIGGNVLLSTEFLEAPRPSEFDDDEDDDEDDGEEAV